MHKTVFSIEFAHSPARPRATRAIWVCVGLVLAICAGGRRVSAQTEPADSPRGLLKTVGRPLGSEQAMSALASLAALEVSTAPLGTSTGGFTFTFDPLLRTWTRSASSFGPAFAERSLTTGRAKISAGFNWLHASYSTFNDQDLTNGDLKLARNIRGFTPLPAASYTGLTLNMSSDTVVTYAHVGVTDDVDVGVAIPAIRISLDGEGAFFNSAGSKLLASAVPQTSSSGIGDVAVFGKYRFVRQQEGGVAAAVEVRLPTGDKNYLRGLDVTRTLMSVIWSQGGKVSPHANVGYELWSEGVPISATGDVYARNQFKYAAGVEFVPNPRATVVVDVVGRYLRHGGKVGYQTFTVGGGASADVLLALPEALHQVAVAPGLKLNVWRSVLVTGNVLATVSNSGLRANLIPVVGVDWAF